MCYSDSSNQVSQLVPLPWESGQQMPPVFEEKETKWCTLKWSCQPACGHGQRNAHAAEKRLLPQALLAKLGGLTFRACTKRSETHPQPDTTLPIKCQLYKVKLNSGQLMFVKPIGKTLNALAAPGAKAKRLCSVPYCLQVPGSTICCFIPAEGTEVTCYLWLAKLDSLLSQRKEEAIPSAPAECLSETPNCLWWLSRKPRSGVKHSLAKHATDVWTGGHLSKTPAHAGCL